MDRAPSFRRAIPGLLCLACACTSHPAPAGRARLWDVPLARGGGPLSLVTAVDMITTERCAHEGSCDRIGPGRRFFVVEDCQRELAEHARKQWNMQVCETGYVEDGELRSCLESIRKAGCTSDVETLCSPAKTCSP